MNDTSRPNPSGRIAVEPDRRRRPLSPAELERRLAEARVQRAEILARRGHDSALPSAQSDDLAAYLPEPGRHRHVPEPVEPEEQAPAPRAAMAAAPLDHGWHVETDEAARTPVADAAPAARFRTAAGPSLLVAFLMGGIIGAGLGALEPLRGHIVSVTGFETISEAAATAQSRYEALRTALASRL